jgi:hypothetical protein
MWEREPFPDPPIDDYARPATPDPYGEEAKRPIISGLHEAMPIEFGDSDDEEGIELVEDPIAAAAEEKDDDRGPMQDQQEEMSSQPLEFLHPLPLQKGKGKALNVPALAIPTPSTISVTTPSGDTSDTPIPGDDSGEFAPWVLNISRKDIEKCLSLSKLSGERKNRLKKHDTLIKTVAISPRGAKWVVGVGAGEAVAIWRLRDKPSTGQESVRG